MISSVLERHLGLSSNEAKVYSILLEYKPKTVNRIAVLGNLHRRNIYDTLAKLQHKGLVSEEISKTGSYYSAVNPQKLREIVLEKTTALEQIMPRMTNLYDQEFQEQRMYMYRGIAGFKNYLSDILDHGSVVYSLGAKGEWYDPQLQEYMLDFWQQKQNKDIESRILFDDSARAVSEISQHLAADSYKFLPVTMNTDSVVEIFEDRIVMFSGIGPKYITQDIMLYIIENQVLAKSYRTWFEFLWDSL